ncbi:sensor histidine kinase [Tessaracoccus terricola]
MKPWAVDALLATGVTAVLVTVILLSQVPTAASPNVLAYLLAAGFGAVLLLRRRMPVPVLLLSVLGTFGYYILDLPPIGVALPVVAALFSAAEVGLTRWAVGAGAVVLAVSLYFRVRDAPPHLGYVLGYDAVSNIALIAAGIALGYSLRARRIRAAQQAEIARLTDAQRAREAESRVRGERERISRELHDTIGHTLSVISLQAGVGTEAVGRDERAVSEALSRIRTASTRSLQELRGMVRILRSGTDRDETRSIASLDSVQDLVDAARGAGVDVATDITASPAELSTAVDAAAYRVIQESITNVVRHADATCARVTVGIHDGRLRISVTDNGRGAETKGVGATSGYGMAGMSERVRLLGGTLRTRSSAGEGFTVEASIPARLP